MAAEVHPVMSSVRQHLALFDVAPQCSKSAAQLDAQTKAKLRSTVELAYLDGEADGARPMSQQLGS
jgi:hypothetical protein